MTIETLHTQINLCTQCRDIDRRQIRKPEAMERGNTQAKVMVVGIAPGNAAIKARKSFGGQSITRLANWFVGAGFPGTPDNLRKSLYLTSLNKCAAVPDSERNRLFLFRRCQQYLWAQIKLIRPRLILLLGHEVAKVLIPQTRDNTSASEIAGQAWSSIAAFGDQLLKPIDVDCRWLAMPHPSGLSRTMNDDAVYRRVINSLRSELQTAEFTMHA